MDSVKKYLEQIRASQHLPDGTRLQAENYLLSILSEPNSLSTYLRYLIEGAPRKTVAIKSLPKKRRMLSALRESPSILTDEELVALFLSADALERFSSLLQRQIKVSCLGTVWWTAVAKQSRAEVEALPEAEMYVEYRNAVASRAANQERRFPSG